MKVLEEIERVERTPPGPCLFLDILHTDEKNNMVFEKLTAELAIWQIKGNRRSRSQG